MKLYFNCDRPVEILREGVIKKSKITGGVSMSDWFDLGSHGPFKIEFKNPLWLPLMHRVLYMTPIQQRTEGKRILQTVKYIDQFGTPYSVDLHNELKRALTGRIVKDTTFEDEKEWWSFSDIWFSLNEITGIYFMMNSYAVQPKIAQRARKELQAAYPALYKEVVVNDPRFPINRLTR